MNNNGSENSGKSLSSNVYLDYIKSMKTVIFLAVAALLLFLALVPLRGTQAGTFNGDCDANSIVNCGAETPQILANKYAGLDGKGKAAFIDAGVNITKINQTKMGEVNNQNQVIVDKKVVATNAYSYGRTNFPGSIQVAGGAFKRHPSQSYAANTSSLKAFVYMENGVFKWAVIRACGNPVTGTPTTKPPVVKTPKQTINKKVTKDMSSSTDVAYIGAGKTVSSVKGGPVRFISQASNTGNVTLNGFVWDKLPPNVTYKSGTYLLKTPGKANKTGNLSKSQNGDFGYLGAIAPGGEVKIDVKAVYNSTVKVTNKACIKTSQISTELCSTATVTPVIVTPKVPSQTIVKKVSTDLKGSIDVAYMGGKESVKVNKGDTVRFISQATNTGAVNITGRVYDKVPKGTTIVPGKSSVQLKEYNATTKKYVTTKGTLVKGKDGYWGWTGTLKPGAEAKLDIWVKYETNQKVRNIACITTPQAGNTCDDAYVETNPRAVCEELKVVAYKAVEGNNKRSFTARASVKNGATIKSYSFDFGDKSAKNVVKTSKTTANSASHTYKPGKYTATVTVTTNLGSVTSAKCKVPIEIKAPTAACVDLSADTVNRTTRKLLVKESVTGGAKVTGYVFDLGNGKKITTTKPYTTQTFTPGTYNTKVTLKTSVGDKTSKGCELKVQIAKEDEPALDIEKRVTSNLSLKANEAGFAKAEELVQVAPGKLVKFIIRFTNTGNIALEDVAVVDVLPAGLNLEEGDLERVIKKIEPNESVYFELTATANESIGSSTVTNVVCARHDTNKDGKIDIANCAPDKCEKNPAYVKGKDLADCDDAKVKILIPGAPGSDIPGVLPRTGVGSVVTGIGGVGFLIAGGHSWVTSRRRLALARLS